MYPFGFNASHMQQCRGAMLLSGRSCRPFKLNFAIFSFEDDTCDLTNSNSELACPKCTHVNSHTENTQNEEAHAREMSKRERARGIMCVGTLEFWGKIQATHTFVH
jgi:hypothetical protein